ncbi:MAG: hypothetical protein KatS3mg129_1733 [Leptospiraceae bacterium]|nr:MAG: hypothetical protein KatS3mg129_1733 [Leptospiraceae bacterium]
MDTNKKKAALLWVLIPIKYRQYIARYLTGEEIEELKNTYYKYQKLDDKTKYKIQKQLYFVFSFPYKIIYISLFILILWFISLFLYYITKISFSPLFVFSLFWPLAMGIMGNAILLTFSSYELYFLFRFSYRLSYNIIAILIFYILIYLLYSINELQKIQINIYYPIEKIILLSGIILAPVLEECIFRHYIPTMFGQKYFYNIIGHIISNIIFSILHLPSWEQGILYFLCGMFLSVLKIWTQRLIYPILVHSFANFFMFYFYL